MEYVRIMLEKYPEPEDWDRVRWSDEIHFGWGAQRQLRIIRKPGERYCVDCVQHREEPKAKDEKRFHCWAAVGYNFKSEIIFYDVPGNTNGKMSLQVYRDQILEPVVKPWLMEGHDFVLEEDGDSGHGLFAPGRKKTSWSTSSTVPHSPTFHRLKTAGNLPNNIWQNIRTGMTAPQRS